MSSGVGMAQLVLPLLFTALVVAEPLRNFQVAQPPAVPQNVKQCTVKVLERTFANSFGQSEIVSLAPPTDCGELGTWSSITLNFTVTSNGTQFDRLGIFNLKGTEIWRTSTPEPIRGDGIIWTYIKDVTQYTPLFASEGTFILQLDNLLTDQREGVYNTVLHATYYASSANAPTAKQSNMIIPISTRANDTGPDASVPPAFNISFAIPQNTIQLFAELYASGNGNEEFWFGNTANEFLSQVPLGPNVTLGQGPFREVRLSVDGKVAGVVFPYVTIFTGGAAPSLWRPISSYGALELPTYHLDLTPFVPLLTDNENHTYTLDVVSAEEDHTTLPNWYVSGILQVITSSSSSERTTGNMTLYQVEEFPETSIDGTVTNGGNDADVTVTGARHIRVESTVVSGDGQSNSVVWSQELQYSNIQNFRKGGLTQVVNQTSFGTIFSAHNGETVVADNFSYPIWMNLTYLTTDLTNWTVGIDHSYDMILHANPLVLGSTIHEHQVADGFYQLGAEGAAGNFGNGTNNNTFSFVDTAGNTYNRNVGATWANATGAAILFDDQSGSLAPYPDSTFTRQSGASAGDAGFAGSGRMKSVDRGENTGNAQTDASPSAVERRKFSVEL